MNNLYIYNKLTYFPCKTWWRRGTTLSMYAEGRELESQSERKGFSIFLFAVIGFFSRLFTCRIASCMHWGDEFRCISMIFGKFNVILVVFCL
jgi:hypothetical protein